MLSSVYPDSFVVLTFLLSISFSSGSSGSVVLTQSPGTQAVQPGATVSITCTASSSVYCSTHKVEELSWYQQRDATSAPTLLISKVSSLQSGVPARYSGKGNGLTYTLSISPVQMDDAAVYYCGQTAHIPYTQW